jgi:hypothetical protein
MLCFYIAVLNDLLLCSYAECHYAECHVTYLQQTGLSSLPERNLMKVHLEGRLSSPYPQMLGEIKSLQMTNALAY